jgi:hypothetical protein
VSRIRINVVEVNEIEVIHVVARRLEVVLALFTTSNTKVRANMLSSYSGRCRA